MGKSRTEILENQLEIEQEYNKRLLANLTVLRENLINKVANQVNIDEVLNSLKIAVNGASDRATAVLREQQQRKDRVILSKTVSTRF